MTSNEDIFAEFADDLPARAAWRNRLRSRGVQGDGAEMPMAGRDCLEDCVALGADRQSGRSILDIDPGVDAAVVRQARGADGKAAVWSMRVRAHGDGGIAQRIEQAW